LKIFDEPVNVFGRRALPLGAAALRVPPPELMPAPSNTHEFALVKRANRGDRAALREIYALHRDWVVRVAHSMTRNRDDALDVAQETFAYLFGKFPGFELRASLRSVLYPAIKHRAIDIGRRRAKVVALDDYRREAREPRAFQAGRDFERLLGQLDERHREVVRLRFALGFRLDEIAAALGIPVGTAKSRLHNGLKSLRTNLEQADAAANKVER